VGPRRVPRPPAPTGHRIGEPVTDQTGRCSFCGATSGPFATVQGLFTVLLCADHQAVRGHGTGPYPVMARAETRACT
jgi:hypothetical protein